jgi:hypothetical protein
MIYGVYLILSEHTELRIIKIHVEFPFEKTNKLGQSNYTIHTHHILNSQDQDTLLLTTKPVHILLSLLSFS